jgi:hypothetical protein
VSGAPLQRFLEGTAKKGGFEVEPTTDLVKVGPHEALALRMQRPGPKGRPQWQYVTALTVNDHLYIFNLLSNEKPPWKNKPALNILARLRFGPVEPE